MTSLSLAAALGQVMGADDAELALDEVLQPKTNISKRILFIVDVSGSMYTDKKIRDGLAFVKQICEQPIDEFEMAIVAFGDRASRWEGYPCDKNDPKPCPKGWAKMPNKEAAEAAQKWLSKHPVNQGTNGIPALEEAFKEEQSDVSVVFVTDGDFNEHGQDIITTIEQKQKIRDTSGKGKFVFFVFGVDATGARREVLIQIARDSSGGYWEKSKKSD
jgi:Mg-chelatase subunit ChlD